MKRFPQKLSWYWMHRRNILWAMDILVRVHTRDNWQIVWDVPMGAIPDHYTDNENYVAAWRIMRKCVGRPV